MHANSRTKSFRAVVRSVLVGLVLPAAAAANAQAVGDQIAHAMRNAEVVVGIKDKGQKGIGE